MKSGNTDHAIRLAVLEERSRGERTARKVSTKYVEWRLKSLNGEATRLKTAADLSVTREKFDDFVNAQRLAFDVYKADMEKRLSAINVKLATWGGALLAAGALVQFLLRKT